MSVFTDVWGGLKSGAGTVLKAGEQVYNRQSRIADAFTTGLEGLSRTPESINNLLNNNTFLYIALAIGGIVVISTLRNSR